MSDSISEPYAVVFAGQGAQARGMLDAYDAHPAVGAAVDEVGDAIGVNLRGMIAEDETALNQTGNTQPAMLAMGVGIYRAVQARLSGQSAPVALAGHSLGEYAALVVAQSIALADAARLVRRRAELMQSAVADGRMAAVLGLDAAVVDSICESARENGLQVWSANYNTANQIVIAGNATSVEQTAATCKAQGAKRSVILPMSVPSHCPLLQPAADTFLADLQTVQWQPPQTPVLHSTTNAVAEPADIPNVMAAQLTRPVHWQKILQQLAAMGAQAVYDCAPTPVLTNLGKKSPLPHHPPPLNA